VLALQADAATTEWLVRYARAVSAGLLALISFGSLLWTPFTELWSSCRFKDINRRSSRQLE
jgi:hypothetical protein